MSFNGSGTFVRLYNWTQDKLNSIKINAARMDGELDGIAAGLSNCITKDGQTTLAADIPFNSRRLTTLGDATADTDALNRQIADARYLSQSAPTLGGTATAYTLTLASAKPSSLANGFMFWANANITNTGGATTLVVTPNSGSAFASKKIKVLQTGTESDPSAGAMIAGNRYLFVYDSSADSSTGAYVLLNPHTAGSVLLASGSAASVGTVSLSLPSGYEEIEVVLTNVLPSASGAVLWARVSLDNGSTYKSGATDYAYTTTGYLSTNTSTSGASAGTTQIPLTVGMPTTTNPAHVSLLIPNPSATNVLHPIWFNSISYASASSAWASLNGMGSYVTSVSAITNIQFSASTGLIGSMNYRVYGKRG